jgi:hypothetical protein
MELVAVMVILSIWAAIGVKKVIAISETAEKNAIVKGVVELNMRESLTWFKLKMSPAGYEGDDMLWATLDTGLGSEYTWTSGPTQDGGELKFETMEAVLTRSRSQPKTPGKWSI